MFVRPHLSPEAGFSLEEDSMQRTRRQILDILKLRGRATLDELSKEVVLSPVTVRVHLSVLQRDDLVSVDEVRGRVGRPYFVYSLTEDAEDLFPKRYHTLAGRLLTGLSDCLPPDTVKVTLTRVAESWATERMPRLAGKALPDRAEEIALIRNEEGAIATCEKVDEGYLIQQFNCPNLLVCRAHTEVCDMEEQYITKMAGTRVTHSSCIGRGDRVCSYLIYQG